MGIILYTLLTGTLPFDDDDESIMREKVIKGEFEDPEWLSDGNVDAVLKSLCILTPRLQRLAISSRTSSSWNLYGGSPLHKFLHTRGLQCRAQAHSPRLVTFPVLPQAHQSQPRPLQARLDLS